MSQKKALPFFVVALIGIYCSDPVKIYPVKGVIVDMRPGENIIVVDHDTIPDLMMPMVMPFNVRDSIEISGISVGDSVHFSFIWNDTTTNASNFIVKGHKNIEPFVDDFFSSDDSYMKKNIGEKINDVTLLDMEGRPVRLSDSNGKYRFISFIFSRCPMPTMCPAVVMKNEVLAKAFRSIDEVELIMVSFDHRYDTPEILRGSYGDILNGYKNWSIWSSIDRIDDIYTLARQVGCDFWGVENNNIGHKLRSVLIDPELRLLADWKGDEWIAEDVEKELKNLISSRK
ncbi:MAG: hypothetical protein CL701_04305 [Chloroflexi bacterium]|nr:hypothetical protein [Chloroflexota bacterium]|tara:strand:+ start:1476 stop:2333 length:858 start_codon:yes stop_codon:yes gene_type:complete